MHLCRNASINVSSCFESVVIGMTSAVKESSALLNDDNHVNNMGSINNSPPRKLSNIPSPSANITDYLHFIYASLFFCMATFFQQSVSPIADVLQQQLDITLSGIGILSSSYFLTYLLCQIPFGILLQTYSHHTILLVVSIILTLCFITFGLIRSLLFAAILRIIGGAFGAPTWLITVTLVGDHFGNNEVQFFGAITTFFSFIITFAGVTIQGYIYEHYGLWRITYFILGLVGAVNVIAIIATMFIQHNRRNKQAHKTNELMQSVESIENDSNKLIVALSNYLNWCLGLYGFAQFSLLICPTKMTFLGPLK